MLVPIWALLPAVTLPEVVSMPAQGQAVTQAARLVGMQVQLVVLPGELAAPMPAQPAVLMPAQPAVRPALMLPALAMPERRQCLHTKWQTPPSVRIFRPFSSATELLDFWTTRTLETRGIPRRLLLRLPRPAPRVHRGPPHLS